MMTSSLSKPSSNASRYKTSSRILFSARPRISAGEGARCHCAANVVRSWRTSSSVSAIRYAAPFASAAMIQDAVK